jgi:gliding motility-associated-like protein
MEFPPDPGNIVFYHEINGQMVSAVYLPSAFSPNDDGCNDLYRPVGDGGIRGPLEMKIYNLNGTEIFGTRDYNFGWDGTINGLKAPPAEYQSVIKLVDTTGYVYDIHSKILLRD